MSSVAQDQKKINETVDKAADQTKHELRKLRAEYEELKRNTKPKVRKAENFLTSPSAIGFYQGFVVGVFVVMGYAKYQGGLKI